MLRCGSNPVSVAQCTQCGVYLLWMPASPHRAISQNKGMDASSAVIYFGFALTGVCCALPGAVLPALLRQWQLSDSGGGTLFLLIWLGSSIGALATRGVLRTSIVAGCGSTALSAAMLAFSGPILAFPAAALYGFGLGLTMTAISLQRQQRLAHRRSVELVRLNLMWAVGAFVCPALVAHALHTGSTQAVLLVIAVLFAALLVLVLLLEETAERINRQSGFSWQSWYALRRIPLPLLLCTVLVTGIEASGGAWLATYAQRAQHALLAIVAAPTCLWGGLLASRLLGSFTALERRLEQELPVLLIAVAGSLGAMLLFRSEASLLICALVLGFGLGPLYPIFLARVLVYRETGSIFFLAGIASALLPWLTGLLSAASRSLRAGLLVTLAGALLLLVCGLTNQAREHIS